MDSDLSDTDFEIDDVESECEPEHRDRDENTHPAVHLPATFMWDDYPDIDPWEPSWLLHFTKQRSVLVDTTHYKPLDYFNLFFPETVFELMSDKTNRYAECFFDSPVELSPHSRFASWNPITNDEMKGYVALQIEMGLY